MKKFNHYVQTIKTFDDFSQALGYMLRSSHRIIHFEPLDLNNNTSQVLYDVLMDVSSENQNELVKELFVLIEPFNEPIRLIKVKHDDYRTAMELFLSEEIKKIKNYDKTARKFIKSSLVPLFKQLNVDELFIANFEKDIMLKTKTNDYTVNNTDHTKELIQNSRISIEIELTLTKNQLNFLSTVFNINKKRTLFTTSCNAVFNFNEEKNDFVTSYYSITFFNKNNREKNFTLKYNHENNRWKVDGFIQEQNYKPVNFFYHKEFDRLDQYERELFHLLAFFNNETDSKYKELFPEFYLDDKTDADSTSAEHLRDRLLVNEMFEY